MLIFVSGKIVITGAKKRVEIEDAFQKVIYVLMDA
jgi:TATA-box binding protein (TBP) (component of TFIID and TFIIIB)